MTSVGHGKRDRKRNQSWLAKKLKVKQQRVSQLIHRDGWRWRRWGWTDDEVEEVRAWHLTLREDNPATASAVEPKAGGSDGGEEPDLSKITDPRELLKHVANPKDRIKLGAVIERAAKVQLDRELLLGGYLKKDDVEAARVLRVQAVRAELANARLLAIKMEGLKVAEMERVLEGWAQGVCNKFERGEV